MSYLDFFVDFAVTGKVLDVGLGSRPGDWSAALGDGFSETSWTDHHLVRQFGLVDANFKDSTGEWVCYYINLRPGQLYRFDDWVPDAISARYGDFPPRVPFDDVVDRLVQAGLEVYHVTRIHQASLEEYWIPDSRVMFELISDYQLEDFPALRLGDVWAVTTATDGDIPAERRTRYR